VSIESRPDSELYFSCRVCSHGVSASSAVGCSKCGCPAHLDCWEFIGGCSTFGCGGTERVPFAQVGDLVPHIDVHLEPGRFDLAALDIQRRRVLSWIVRTARSLPRTLAAGLLGSFVSLLGFWILVPSFNEMGVVAVLVFGVGLVHGLLAPFLAQLQIHKARALLLATAPLVVGLMAFGRFYWYQYTSSIDWMPCVILIGLISTIFGSTLAEFLFGRRRTSGTGLESVARPLRYLTSGIGCGAIILFSLVLVEQGPIPFRWALETLPFVLTAIFCAGHPIETGKQEYFQTYEAVRVLDSSATDQKKSLT